MNELKERLILSQIKLLFSEKGKKVESAEEMIDNISILAESGTANGKEMKFLPLAAKRLFLLLLYPERHIKYDVVDGRDTDGSYYCSCTCTIYSTFNDPKIELGTAKVKIYADSILQGEFLSDKEREAKTEASARGSAETRAIASCGIGLAFSSDTFDPEKEVQDQRKLELFAPVDLTEIVKGTVQESSSATLSEASSNDEVVMEKKRRGRPPKNTVLPSPIVSEPEVSEKEPESEPTNIENQFLNPPIVNGEFMIQDSTQVELVDILSPSTDPVKETKEPYVGNDDFSNLTLEEAYSMKAEMGKAQMNGWTLKETVANAPLNIRYMYIKGRDKISPKGLAALRLIILNRPEIKSLFEEQGITIE